MQSQVIVRMSKSYGKNMPGDVCGFEEDTVKWIEKHDGCKRLSPAELAALNSGGLAALEAEAEKAEKAAADAKAKLMAAKAAKKAEPAKKPEPPAPPMMGQPPAAATAPAVK